MDLRARLVALALLTLGCAGPERVPMHNPALIALLNEAKFQPDQHYTGVDLPEDQAPLEAAVNGAIRDIGTMADPVDADDVRRRLRQLVSDVDLFATADRDRAYIYAIRIWRAAGFRQNSDLFPRSDDDIIAMKL